MEDHIHLSVVLPCYNPTEGWAEQVVNAFAKIKTEIDAVELLIVNDGSTKNVLQKDEILFAQNKIQFIGYATNRGKGFALREGVKQAKGSLVIYTDIDFPYTHESFMAIYRSLVIDKNDVAIGVRGEEYYAHLPKARIYISKTLRFFIQLLLRIPTNDTQCGLKGFNQNGKATFLTTTIERYLFDLEFIYLAANSNLKISTIPVQLKENIQLSVINSRILYHEGVNFLKVFVRSIFSK